jgi:hypothetical protein
MRKAQGLSLTYIILAAIGLILFVVIIAIFSENSMQASSTLKENTKCLCSDYVDGSTILASKCSKDTYGQIGETWQLKTECEKYFDCGTDNCYVREKS